MPWRSSLSPLQNLKLAVERCHLNVVGTLFGAYACGLATLTEDEKQIGATVIDMGGGVTSIAVFLEGHLVHADVVPMGGFAVTTDIARMLAAPLSRRRAHQDPVRRGAGRYGSRRRCRRRAPRWARRATMPPCACRAPCSPASSRPGWRRFSARCRRACGPRGYDVAAGRRAVLTGGACQLAGTRELAARILNKQVRIGRPPGFPGLAAASAGPDYATAIGLLMAGATMPPELLNPDLALGHRPGEGRKLARPVDRQVASSDSTI